MNVILAFILGLVGGLLLGFFHGGRMQRKQFYKHPRAHWRIRGD